MPKNNVPSPQKPASLAPQARQIIRSAIKVSLATNDRKKPWPFLSLTSVATLMDGSPVVLLSSIAHHTRNIAVNPHVALLFDGTPAKGNPLEDGRITLHGTLEKDSREQTSLRFMARHPTAFYAEFADFDFYTLDLHSAHYVAGFGSTNTLSPAHLLLSKESQALKKQENPLIQRLTENYADKIQNMGHQSLPDKTDEEGIWRLSALDPEGCDLMKGEQLRARYTFSQQVTTEPDIIDLFTALFEPTK